MNLKKIDMYESDNGDYKSKFNDELKIIVNELKNLNENENENLISETDDFLGFINMDDLFPNGTDIKSIM